MSQAPSYPGLPAPLPEPDAATVLRLALTAILGGMSEKRRYKLRWTLESATMALRNRGADRWNVVSLRSRHHGALPTSEGLAYMAAADCLDKVLAALPWSVLLSASQEAGQ